MTTLPSNPELSYVQHIQNNSYSKQCYRFSKEPRFSQLKKTRTDFYYDIKLPPSNKACGFGFGSRVDFVQKEDNPSPNKYQISKFPHNHRSAVLGYNRKEVVFRSMMNQIQKRADLPGPASYETPSGLKNTNFTLKIKLPDEITLKTKKGSPGPGEYEIPKINGEGKYVYSKYKNTRSILLTNEKNGPQWKQDNIGPGQYDVNDFVGIGCSQKINILRRTTTKPFGTSIRKGPEERYKKDLPGPGMYDTFSEFGDVRKRQLRSKTEVD